MTIKRDLIGLIAVVAAAVQVGSAQGPGRGAGGPGGPGGEDRRLVAQFDRDENGRLNAAERREARAFVEGEGGGAGRGRGGFGGPVGPRGRGGPGGPRGSGAAAASPTAGPRLTPADVRTYSTEPFYDPAVLRTVFLEFENEDWEKELMAFYHTDVEVPATAVIDGRTYRDVGVHFRGASSFFSVPAGLKHSLNLSLDFVHDNQQVGGYRTLNLLNSNGDPTYLRAVLYLQAAREFIPAPKANYLRVVINGESWGVYVSAQQFNKDFVRDWFQTTDGARWKVPGSPGGRGGLEYLGEDPAAYRRSYEIKSKDTQEAWRDLITLTRVLNTTPADRLEQALAPLLDIDGALKFLALDVALVNMDGYWTRASDYSLYQDPKGRFHVIPHDANETFGTGPGGMRMGGGPMGPPPGLQPPMAPPGGPFGPPAGGGRGRGGFGGPGGGRGMGGGGPELDPLVGLDDPTKPLRSKLLAVPALRERYLGYVRDIARTWLDWDLVGPLAAEYQSLIAADMKTDTRKLDAYEAFEAGVSSLRTFMNRRRETLLQGVGMNSRN